MEMNDQDLTPLLQSWVYEEDRTVRIIVAEDGRSLVQVRLPLGIEQYELHNRPDGRQPYGYPSVLEYLEDRLQARVAETGSDDGFQISSSMIAELQAEGILYYKRYSTLLTLEFHDLVEADTEHNLRLCELMERYVSDPNTRDAVLQFRPLIVGVNIGARASRIEKGEVSGDSAQALREGIRRIRNLPEIDTPVFQFERARAVQYLQALAARVSGSDGSGEEDSRENRSPGTEATGDTGSRRVLLQRELAQAIAREEYEEAARLRDELYVLDHEGDFQNSSGNSSG